MKNTDEVGKWIPVAERLPEKEGEYIVTGRFDENSEFYVEIINWGYNINSVSLSRNSERVYSNGGAFGELWGNEIDNLYEVKAWMPIPEAWQGMPAPKVIESHWEPVGLRWIPVSERLPEAVIKVEVTADGGNDHGGFMISDPVLAIRKIGDGYRVDTLQWEEDDQERKYWVGSGGEIYHDVAAWMPLEEVLETWRGE